METNTSQQAVALMQAKLNIAGTMSNLDFLDDPDFTALVPDQADREALMTKRDLKNWKLVGTNVQKHSTSQSFDGSQSN